MEDITGKYLHMIHSFECDFSLAQEGKFCLSELDLSNERLANDIRLMEELSFLLRHGYAKIVKVKFED